MAIADDDRFAVGPRPAGDPNYVPTKGEAEAAKLRAQGMRLMMGCFKCADMAEADSPERMLETVRAARQLYLEHYNRGDAKDAAILFEFDYHEHRLLQILRMPLPSKGLAS
jgi:hypothetical protein